MSMNAAKCCRLRPPRWRQDIRAADIIVTATTASEPLFAADLVKPGAVVMACGSHDPHSRELPAELFTSALVDR